MKGVTMFNSLCFDLETQLSADAVGGWHNADQMRVSVACAKESGNNQFFAYTEDQIHMLVDRLKAAELVIGFNVIGFDYKVLSRYTTFDFSPLPTFDLLVHVKNTLRHRVSLDSLAQATLGTSKTGDGLEAIKWFEEGEFEKIIRYCSSDVSITEDLFNYALDHNQLLFNDKWKPGAKVVDTSHWRDLVEGIIDAGSVS